MVALVFAAALASNVAWSPSPISVKFHSGIWAGPQPKDPYVNEAIALVPKNASVSATYDIDSHMTHRVLIYEYPNPWVVAYWGPVSYTHLDVYKRQGGQRTSPRGRSPRSCRGLPRPTWWKLKKPRYPVLNCDEIGGF